jgi:SNF2 family DNA or RNA helicase
LNLPQLTETNIWLDFPPAQRSAYQRLFDMAKTEFHRYETAGKAVSKTLVVMQLLMPMRRACAGDTINIAELERKFKGEEDRLKAIGFSAADIAAGRQFLRTTIAAFNSDEAECPICFEVMENPMQTPCRHVFCRDCICSIAIDSAKCPICRDSISMSTLRRPGSAAADADSEALAMKAAEDAGEVNFDTKIKALLLELDKMKVSHPREKSLVFSQFATSMMTVKERLTEKGIRWRSISGDMSADDRQKQIDFFNRDPPGSVFLLTMRTGAVGLTLTSATHVFIMDPALNPALEQQATNRVYRMGQTKNVYIKRFLVRGTVEENIEKLQRSRSDVDIERTSNRQQLRMNELRVCVDFSLVFSLTIF